MNPTETGEENSMQVEDSVGDDCDDVEILDATEVSDWKCDPSRKALRTRVAKEHDRTS